MHHGFCVICHLLIDYSILVFIGGVELHQSTPTTVLLIVLPGANNRERATSMSSCHGIYTDKLFLERLWCEFRVSFGVPQTSQQKLQT